MQVLLHYNCNILEVTELLENSHVIAQQLASKVKTQTPKKKRKIMFDINEYPHLMELIDNLLNDQVFEQGLQDLIENQPISKRYIGPFVAWVKSYYRDHSTYVFEDDNLSNLFERHISSMAREWLLSKINSESEE
eukprot:TRINITY_DN9410_c0_g1_i2.p1 TRINITY_DN9410_c0_g1~~TRINITY_DN9410_c0_g1_i2.p1  ORF type:complete len:135 (+),score=27.56 TRINITY_DN9410_c0_g1_i2:642-1046(+)